MPRKKKTRLSRKHNSANEKRQSYSKNTSDSEFIAKQTDKNSIEYQIVHAKHPFEKLHFIEGKTLTPSQRAITCCIQLNGGQANEDELLNFLQTNWGFIGKMNMKLPNNMPDTRILHINLAVKKKGIPLFVQKVDDPLTWVLNTNTNGPGSMRKSRSAGGISLYRSSKKEKDDEQDEASIVEEEESFFIKLSKEPDDINSFEALVFAELKKHDDGITLDNLVNETKGLEGKDGLFKQLDHKRRVRAVLISKKAMGHCFEKDGVWSIEDKTKVALENTENSFFPDCLKSIKIPELTIDEFYRVLKSEHS
jgi:hypothetical protein